MKKLFLLFLLTFSLGQSQNLLTNGNFASGTANWTGNNFSVVAGEAFISATNSGGNEWDTQLVQGAMSFTAGTRYTLTFKARAAANRNIVVAIQNVGIWNDQFRQSYALTTTMQTFTATFNAPITNGNVQIGFLMAGQGSTAAVYYDDVSISQNLITNGNFSSGTANWVFTPTGTVTGGEAFFSSANAGGNPWDTELKQLNLSFTNATTYTLTFRARAAANRNISVNIQNTNIWNDQFRNDAVPLTTTMTTYSYTFNATSTNANAQLNFHMANMGVNTTAAVYIDEVSIVRVVNNTCSNGIQDGDETGVDCGGSCPTICPPPAAPNPPARNAWDVRSYYSDAYANNPFNWIGSATTPVLLGGNNARFVNDYTDSELNFTPTNISQMTTLHIDIYSDNQNPTWIRVNGIQFVATTPVGTWASLDIPLSSFPGLNLTSVNRVTIFNPRGAQTPRTDIYLDNIYFYRPATDTPPSIGALSVPSPKVLGDAPFTLTNPTSNSSGAWTYSASPSGIVTFSGNTVTIVGAGTTTITATQAAVPGSFGPGVATATLVVNFPPPGPSPIPPPRDPARVIPVYSGIPSPSEYTNNPNFTVVRANWSPGAVLTPITNGTNTALKIDNLGFIGLVDQTERRLNINGMTNLHLDVYVNTPFANLFFWLLAPGDQRRDITNLTAGWNSINIPLSQFPGANLSDIYGFKFEQNTGTPLQFYVDNIYFSNDLYPFYADSDGDGFGAGNVVNLIAVNGSTPPSGYSANNTDCDDSNPLVWQSGNFYIDFDGDGYSYDNVLYPVCYGATLDYYYNSTSIGLDCDDFNPAVSTPPTASISGSNSICAGNSTPIGGSITAFGAWTLTLSNGSTVSGSGSGSWNTSVSPATTTPFTIVSLSDTSGCATSANDYAGSVTVMVNPLPTATIAGTTAVCNNSAAPSVIFTGASGTAPYTFTYALTNLETNTTTSQTVTTTTGDSVAVVAPTNGVGTFVYELLSIQDSSSTACSQAQSGSATVTVNPLPTATIAGSTQVCQNDTAPLVTFTAGNGTAPYTFTYTLDNGANQTVVSIGATATIAAPTTAAGTFTYTLVSVQDSSSSTCSQEQIGSATIVVHPTPMVTTVLPNQSYYSGFATAAIPLAGTPAGVTFNITGGAVSGLANVSGVTTIPSFIPTTTPSTVTVTPVANGCIGISKTYQIMFNPVVVNMTANQCGSVNNGLNNQIQATSITVPGYTVTGYRFEVTNTATGEVAYVDTVQSHFKLTDTDIYAYGTTYSIRVAAILNGNVQGFFGNTCNLTTASVQTTKVINSQCGATLAAINSSINANSVGSTNLYRFRVALASAPTTYYLVERTVPNFNLTMVAGLPILFETEYKVDVQIRVKLAGFEAWSQFGAVCSIFTPAAPTNSVVLAQCEMVATSYNQVINATPFTGASTYRFLLTGYDNETGGVNYTQFVDNASASFTLSQFTGLTPNTTYIVSVAMEFYGVFTPYGKDCTVTTPGSARLVATPFSAVAYPNPFAEGFKLDVKTSNTSLVTVTVYDMLGRQLETRSLKATEMENTTIGDNYPSGVYNVIVTQDNEVQTLRVVKR